MLLTVHNIVKITNSKTFNFKHYSQQNYRKFKPPWKVLFFGSDTFSLYSLKALYGEYVKQNVLQKLEVVTSFKSKMNPVHKFATRENLQLHQWPLESIDSSFEIGLVVSFGHLIPANIINSLPLGILNVHASLLPRWRGASPIIHAIAKGDKTTGITIMRIKPEKFDVGEIVAQEEVSIPRDMVMPDLYNKLADLGAQTLLKSLKNMPDNLHQAKPQAEIGVTLAPRIKPSFAHIDWEAMAAEEIYNLCRALVGIYPLSTSWNGVPIKIHDVKLCESNLTGTKLPGSVSYDKFNKCIKVQCADGRWICIDSVGVHNRSVMNANDFNNGYIKKQDEMNRFFK